MPLNPFRIAPVATLLLLTATGPAWAQSQIVSTQIIQPTSEDSEATAGPHVSLNFGAAVAISGRTAAIGIPHEVEEQAGPGPGRVGIYTKTEAGWVRSATLLPSNASDVRFGRDLDLCGNLLVVEAEKSTYVFRGRGAHWREIQRIALSSPDKGLGTLVCGNDSFAQSVSTLNDQGEPRGTVHVYEQRRGHDFERVAKLRASDPNDSIGHSLAMERGILVAGSDPDGAYVFVRHGHRWIERQKLQSFGPNGAGIDAAVAIRDRIIIAGAPGVEVSAEPLAPAPDGVAFVYLPYRNSWFESQSLNNPPALPYLNSSGHFGAQIAMGRHLAAVLVPRTNSDQIRHTSVVIVFDRLGEEFTLARGVYGAGEESEIIPDIDMSGRRLILGREESRRFNSIIIGRVVILEFEASPAPVTQTDWEDADRGEADEP